MVLLLSLGLGRGKRAPAKDARLREGGLREDASRGIVVLVAGGRLQAGLVRGPSLVTGRW